MWSCSKMGRNSPSISLYRFESSLSSIFTLSILSDSIPNSSIFDSMSFSNLNSFNLITYSICSSIGSRFQVVIPEPFPEVCIDCSVSADNSVKKANGCVPYPNPTFGELRFDQFQPGPIFYIKTESGKTVMEGQLKSNNLNLSDLSPGLY